MALCPEILQAIAVVGSAIIGTAAVTDIHSKLANQELVPLAGRRPTAAEKERNQEVGKRTGCMTCGTDNPGTKSGKWIDNFVPPQSLAMPGEPFQIGPHCQRCSDRQGRLIRQLLRRIGEALSGEGGPPALPVGAAQVEDSSQG